MAWLRIAGGLTGAFLVPDLSYSFFPNWVLTLVVAVFAIAAIMLFVGGRTDSRAIHLGCAFFLVASSFSTVLFPKLVHVWSPWSELAVGFLEALQPGVFLAYFLWLFFSDFPRGATPFWRQRLGRICVRASLVVGVLLFLSNLLAYLVGGGGDDELLLTKFLALFSRESGGAYWPLLFLLILIGLPYMLSKVRYVPRPERRRVKFFAASLLAGFGPIVVIILLESFIPAFEAWISVPLHRKLSGFLIYPSILSIPITTSYSVLVNHVLDVRLIVRKALRYAMARYTLLALTVTPWLLVVIYLFQNRNVTVADLLSGGDYLWLFGISALGALFLAFRHRAFDRLDRQFFREQYDTRRTLLDLSRKCQSATDVEELTGYLVSSIDAALHLQTISVFIMDPARAVLIANDGRSAPLSCSSRLVSLLTDSREPLEIEFENPNSLANRLPSEDQEWLVDGDFRLMLPLTSTKGDLQGVIALGEKMSELPFSSEDQLLLSTIAISSATMLENREVLTPYTPVSTGRGDSMELRTGMEVALECLQCQSLNPGEHDQCRHCAGDLVPTMVPYILQETFLMQKRIGQGGMGVVYLAHDLTLDRKVAIKTLPRMAPELAIRLRREAKAMAAMQHANLATIYGAPTWRGTPLLILEFLAGGTLADRLKKQALTPLETVELGIPLADVLVQTHAQGTLHRDIKPSNIGFNLEGVPKLMDFGLARIIEDTRVEAPIRAYDPLTQSTVSPDRSRSLTRKGARIGTPPYLSPEAVRKMKPDTSFDLWSLAVTLYESITGTNPFRRESTEGTLESILNEEPPDIRTIQPECSAPVAGFFLKALAHDRRKRPSDARQFRRALRGLHLQIADQVSSESRKAGG